MKNNHKIALAGAMLFASGGSCLADTKIGIGTGALSVFSQGTGGVISMPIKLDSYMLIEPYVGYTERSVDIDTSLPDYSYNNFKSYQVGVGLYGISKLGTEFELYYGAALASVKSKRNYESKRTGGTDPDTYLNFNRHETETTEYMIKPTLGVGYLVNENFSVSLDAGIYYYWGEEKNKDIYTYKSSISSTTDVSESTADVSGVNTFTRLVFRMMF